MAKTSKNQRSLLGFFQFNTQENLKTQSLSQIVEEESQIGDIEIILKPIGDSIFLKFILKTLKQLENIIKMIPISIPLQVSIDQTSISDHLMKRTSGDKINAPILAIPIPLKRFPDKEKFKILPKYYYY
mgnify:CR=1 FL=1